MNSKNLLSSATSTGLPWHAGQIKVLRTLHLAGKATRAELSGATGLSPQSLTRITQELISGGYVQEVQRRHTGGMGQPAIEMSLAPGRLLSIGLVLEHDRITCVTSDLAKGVIHRLSRDGEFLSAKLGTKVSVELVAKALKAIPKNTTLLGLGISQSGFFFDLPTRRMISKADIEGWKQIDLAELMRQRFSIDVDIENDGSAAAAGHLVHGVGTRYRSFFLVYMTRGLGGGVVSERRLWRGRSGNAGEIGNLLPELSKGLARPSLENLTNRLSKAWNRPASIEEIETALSRKDPALMSWLDEAAGVLRSALISICAILDPEAVILAGRMPLSIRTALADRLNLRGVTFVGISAPPPDVVVDPDSDCLEHGAAALPVTRFFARHVDKINSL